MIPFCQKKKEKKITGKHVSIWYVCTCACMYLWVCKEERTGKMHANPITVTSPGTGSIVMKTLHFIYLDIATGVYNEQKWFGKLKIKF